MPQLDNGAFSLGILVGLIFSCLGLGLMSSKLFWFYKEIPTTTLLFQMKKQEVEFVLSSLFTKFREQDPYAGIPPLTSINFTQIVNHFFLLLILLRRIS